MNLKSTAAIGLFDILNRIEHAVPVICYADLNMSASRSNASQRRKSSRQVDKDDKPPQVSTVEYEVPDGGYGWMIVFCAFVFISIPMGVSASFAIYYEEWIDVFDAGIFRTSLVGSVGSGCVPLLGNK